MTLASLASPHPARGRIDLRERSGDGLNGGGERGEGRRGTKTPRVVPRLTLPPPSAAAAAAAAGVAADAAADAAAVGCRSNAATKVEEVVEPSAPPTLLMVPRAHGRSRREGS